jgi:hypothetical protein
MCWYIALKLPVLPCISKEHAASHSVLCKFKDTLLFRLLQDEIFVLLTPNVNLGWKWLIRSMMIEFPRIDRSILRDSISELHS